jgi:hypothetical protein
VSPIRQQDSKAQRQARIALPRIPLIPDEIVRRNNVFFEIDTRFRRAARLLQRLWLKNNNIATGMLIQSDAEGETLIPLGSLLSREAANAGRNFLSPAPFIPSFVRNSSCERRVHSSQR